MSLQFTPLELADVVLIEPRRVADGRGFFVETYRVSQFAEGGIRHPFVQDNHSRSNRHVLRGLHFQRPPHAQAKLVQVVRGEIFDVAVDVRRGSPTFGRWIGTVLSEENRRMLYIPVGFAHGFCVTSDTADVVYKVSSEYAPAHDTGIRWDDPRVGVRWPIAAPVLSTKDAQLPLLSECDTGFDYADSTAAPKRGGGRR